MIILVRVNYSSAMDYHDYISLLNILNRQYNRVYKNLYAMKPIEETWDLLKQEIIAGNNSKLNNKIFEEMQF